MVIFMFIQIWDDFISHLVFSRHFIEYVIFIFLEAPHENASLTMSYFYLQWVSYGKYSNVRRENEMRKGKDVRFKSISLKRMLGNIQMAAAHWKGPRHPLRAGRVFMKKEMCVWCVCVCVYISVVCTDICVMCTCIYLKTYICSVYVQVYVCTCMHACVDGWYVHRCISVYELMLGMCLCTSV